MNKTYLVMNSTGAMWVCDTLKEAKKWCKKLNNGANDGEFYIVKENY